jgi:hypothetical protein
MNEARALQNDDQVAWDVTIVREKPGVNVEKSEENWSKDVW